MTAARPFPTRRFAAAVRALVALGLLLAGLPPSMAAADGVTLVLCSGRTLVLAPAGAPHAPDAPGSGEAHGPLHACCFGAPDPAAAPPAFADPGAPESAPAHASTPPSPRLALHRPPARAPPVLSRSA